MSQVCGDGDVRDEVAASVGTNRVDSRGSTYCSSSYEWQWQPSQKEFVCSGDAPKMRGEKCSFSESRQIQDKASCGSLGEFEERQLPHLKPVSSVGAMVGRVGRFYLDVGREYKWGTYRSKLIGFSSLLYALSGFLLLTLHPPHLGESPREATLQLEAYGWFFVATASFFSDFVFAGRRENRLVRLVHLTDRWIAGLAVLHQVFVNVPSWFSVSAECGVAGSLLLSICFSLKAISSRASTRVVYKYSHTLWHVVGVAARALMGMWESEALQSKAALSH